MKEKIRPHFVDLPPSPPPIFDHLQDFPRCPFSTDPMNARPLSFPLLEPSSEEKNRQA